MALNRRAHAHRYLLHHSKMQLFLKWVVGEGYIVHPRPEKAIYEVGRIEKFTPQGNNPHIVFYKRDRTEHVTVPREADKLVRKFIKWYKSNQEE